MTVAELIAALQALPPDLLVLVDGYEGGMDEAQAPRRVDALGPDAAGWSVYGDYFDVTDTTTPHSPDLPALQAVFISRHE